MKLDAKRYGQGRGVLPESFHAEAEVTILLQAFENELDALLKLIDSDSRTKAAAEAVYRRYMAAEDVFKNIDDSYGRIVLKMSMVSDSILGGLGGRSVLESTREPDQETT